MVMYAELTSREHPEYGVVTVPLPIPREEYDHTIALLEGMGVGDVLKRDCQVVKLESPCSILRCLELNEVNVDELDYLAKRLESFCASETAQFQAMAHKLELSHIVDLINLTYCCQQATVITDFSDLERIGKNHVMTVKGGSMPMEQLQAVDGRTEAIQLIQSGGGTVTPFGVAYDNGMELERCYNGYQFPAYLYDSCLMVLEIAPKRRLAEDENPEYLYLPAAEHQIERTLLRVGVTALSDAQVRLDFDELPEKVAEALEPECLSGDDLPDLNRMCKVIELLKAADIEKLNAVVLMTEASDADVICWLAENLDQFDFVPGVQTPEDYGRYMIQQSGRFEYDEKLAGFYDYRSYGEQRIREEGGQFNECGYVAYQGTLPLEELMRSDLAEQQQQEQGPQMGGYPDGGA